MNSKKLSEIAAVLNLEISRKAPDFLVCSIPGRNDLELTIEKNGSTVSFTIGRYGGAGHFVQIPNVKEGEELHQFNLAKSIVPEGDGEYISQQPTQMNAPASYQGQINVDLIAGRTSEVFQAKLLTVFNAIDKKIDFIGNETISIKRETQQLERIIEQSNVKAEVPYMEISKKPGISLEDIAVSIDKLTAQIDSRINSLSSKLATIEQSQQALDEQNAAALSRANTNEIVPKLNDISNELKPLKTDLLAWNRRNFRFTLVFAAIACVASSFIFTSSGFGRNELKPTTERSIRALPNP